MVSHEATDIALECGVDPGLLHFGKPRPRQPDRRLIFGNLVEQLERWGSNGFPTCEELAGGQCLYLISGLCSGTLDYQTSDCNQEGFACCISASSTTGSSGGSGGSSSSSSSGGPGLPDSGGVIQNPLTTTSAGPGTSDGTLSQSVDGTLLYAVSADDGQLLVVDPTGFACPVLPPPGGEDGGSGLTLIQACIVASVPVGTQPSRVIVGADETVYVSNRKSRSISVIRPPQAGGAWAVSATLPTDAEPLGMALSPGAQTTLYVANHGSGTVEAFDLATSSVVWDTTVGNFPRSVAALADGELYVSHYRSGMVDILDAATGVVPKSVSASVGAVPSLTQATTQTGTVFQPTFSAVALDSLVVSPDGQRVYLAHRRERSGIISDVSFPPIVAPAITTFETATDLPHDDALETSQTYPPTIIYPENRIAQIPFFQPRRGIRAGGGRAGGGGGGTPGLRRRRGRAGSAGRRPPSPWSRTARASTSSWPTRTATTSPFSPPAAAAVRMPPAGSTPRSRSTRAPTAWPCRPTT